MCLKHLIGESAVISCFPGLGQCYVFLISAPAYRVSKEIGRDGMQSGLKNVLFMPLPCHFGEGEAQRGTDEAQTWFCFIYFSI